MHDRLADLESRIAAVERRVDALENTADALVSPDHEAPVPSLGEGFVTVASAHVGRVMLIFGGAYLLRAITDFQFVPTALGISMGASYALFWLFMAYRKSGVVPLRSRAAFYGGTSVLLSLPLLVEAVSKFNLLSGPQGIAALTAFCAFALAVSIGRNLRTLAWLTTAGGIGTAMAVMIVSHTTMSTSAFLLALGLASLWAVYYRQWIGLQWLGALGANVGVIVLVIFGTSDQWTIEPRTAVLYSSVLLPGYLLSFAVHSHARAQNVGFFEVAQALAAAGIAAWAAGAAAHVGHSGLMIVGLLSILLGCGAYALAFSPATHVARGRNFYYYANLGLLLLLAGTAIVLSPIGAAALWSAMALTMAWISGRTGWVTLSLQCTILLVAAGVRAGLLAVGLHALIGEASAAWPPLNPVHVGIALTTVVCLFLPVAQQSERWGTLAGAPQLIVLALSVWEVGGLMVLFLASWIADVRGAEPNLAILAALRTVILSTSSVTLALSSRFQRWPEARWLVYPVLIIVAIKLFVEDFPNGEPGTLFVALAFVGGALLLVARLLAGGKSRVVR